MVTRTKLAALLVALLLGLVAGVASADIGTILWKQHCPDGASVMTVDGYGGGVDVVCIQLVRRGK